MAVMSRCSERRVAYDRGTTWAIILRVVSTSCGSHGMPCEVAYIGCEPNVTECGSYGWLLYKASIPGELGQSFSSLQSRNSAKISSPSHVLRFQKENIFSLLFPLTD